MQSGESVRVIFMSEMPRLAIAMGDPAGISPELLAKLLNQKDLLALAAVTVIGDRRVLALGEKAAGIALDDRNRRRAGKRRGAAVAPGACRSCPP